MTAPMTCEQASDIAGESAATWAHMMSGDMDEQLMWFDEVYESIMVRLIRKALTKGQA